MNANISLLTANIKNSVTTPTSTPKTEAKTKPSKGGHDSNKTYSTENDA